MTLAVHPFLRYLASWDRDEAGFHATLAELALRPVRFSGVPRRHDDLTSCLSAFVVDPMAAVTEAPDGTLLLPGNPHQVLREIVEERFAPSRRPHWHRLPLSVRRSLVTTRRIVRGRQALPPLGEPRPGQGLAWPDEPRVDRYRRALFEGLVEERFRPGGARGAAGTHRHRAELLAPPWPERGRYALCLGYDVASREGLRLVPSALQENLARGVRPAFYLAPLRGLWDDALLDEVRSAGGEIGLLGLVPGTERAPLRPRRLERAVQRVIPWLERHEVVGHRDPCRRPSEPLLRALAPHLLYDGSVPDTVLCPVTGARRGCAVTVPFWREVMLQLPITVPDDGQLRDHGVAGLEYLELLRAKVRAIARRHGVAALALRLEPGAGGSRVQRDLVGAALEELRDEGGLWTATPRELATLWREAAAVAETSAADAPPHRL